MDLAPAWGVWVPSRPTQYQDKRPTRDDPGLDPSKTGKLGKTVKWLTTRLVHTVKWKQQKSLLVKTVNWIEQVG